MPRIVFVEDDAELGALIKGFLSKHDLDVTLVPRAGREHTLFINQPKNN